MDFNSFDSVAAAETGADCHVRHPVSLKPLFDNPDDPTVDNGKPCIVILMGAEAPSVRSASRALQKARAQAKDPDADGDKEGGDGLSLDEIHDRMVEGLAPRVLGFKNIHKGKQAATKADAAWFFNLNRLNGREDEKSFAEQAAEFSGKRASYLGNGSPG